MSKELVIAANRHETKVALLEDDQLVEVFFQRANEYSLAGSIHKGRVTRVLPGMQSAFVDLGLERDTFLYVTDFFEEGEDFDRLAVTREEAQEQREPREPQAVEEPVVEPEGTAPPEVLAEAPAAAAGEPAVSSPRGAAPYERHERSERSERTERSDEGDRRGRRSRRRRNRGRGFPESKYAPAEPREPRESRYVSEGSRHTRPRDLAPSTEASAETPAGPNTGDFAVLPGESLAKYTRANIQPLDEDEAEEIRSLQESEDGSGPEAASAEEVTGEPAVGEEAPESEASDPDIRQEEQAPETPASPVQAGPSGAATAAALDTSEAAVAPEATEQESEAELESGDETAAEAGLESDAEAIAATDTAAEPSAEEVQPTEAAGAEAQGPQLAAQVREHGGRYMHRVSRRMRRKMRGGAPEGKPEGERVREGAAPPVEVTRPEAPRGAGRPDRAPTPSITELLKEGQEIIVQIAKEPLGQKGARITSHIALPGRFVVYMPTLEHTGVSRKIASDEERQRLKRILAVHHAGIPGGFIVRTAGEGKTEAELAADMNFLFNLWLDIRQKAEKRPAPLLLHHDLDIVQRTLRDQFTEQFKAIWVDNEELYESVLRFVQRFQPNLVNRVKLYTRPEPIFDAFGITAELEKALRPKVWLKSGGYIVINQTEALVAVDVNTGKYVGKSNRLEDTIVKTNTEAVKEIVRQIRLRDLGGIIVVDFIDMDERKNRQKVMQALEDAMRSDRAPYKILQFNDFGLVAITRKRVKQSLERALCMPCPHCEGSGYVKSVQTIVGEILQEAHKLAGAVEGKDVLLRVHPDVARMLKSNHNKYLEELEEILRRPVLVKGDPLLHHEKFDLT